MNPKAARLTRGLGVNDAADAMGVPPYVLRAAETGTRPRPENAKRIADFYDVLVTDIWPVENGNEAAA
jgi:hypothetical protein